MMYRMKSGKFYRFSEQGTQRFVPGDVLEPTEAELKAFGDLMEKVSGQEIVITVDASDLNRVIDRLKNLTGETEPGEEPEAPVTIDSGAVTGETAENLAEAAATIDSGETSAPEEAETGVEEPAALLAKRLGPEIMQALEAGGICSLDDLVKVAADPDALAKIKGIGKAKARLIREEMMKLEPDPEG